MRPRLAALAEFVRAAAGPTHAAAPPWTRARCSSATVAARAGLGWIGKNTNLLATGLGSYFFIASSSPRPRSGDEGQPDRCGTCTACLDACPTRAFVAPYVLDARRCIAYLTIEHRGDVAEDLREGIGEWLFGCDICQEVCPWTRKPGPAATSRSCPLCRRGHSRRSFTSTAMPSERASGTHPSGAPSAPDS